MVLSGWTQAPKVERDDNKTVGNGGKKRKLDEIPNPTDPNLSKVADETKNYNKKHQVLDDDDLVMLDGENLGINKKKKLQ